MFYQIKTAPAGNRNQSHRRRIRQQNIHKSTWCQNSSKHSRFFHCSECRWSETVWKNCVHLVRNSLAFMNLFFRAWFYCKACHDDIKDETLIKKCKCKNCELNFFLKIFVSIFKYKLTKSNFKTSKKFYSSDD